MEKKGLCQTCNNNQACMFQKGLVLQCEEFSDYVAGTKISKPAILSKATTSCLTTECE